MQKILKKSWRHRMAQENEECEALFRQMLRALRLTPTDLLRPSSENVNSDSIGQLQLLYASLLRAEGNIEAAKSLIQNIEEHSKSLGIPFSFQFHFQRGSNSYHAGEYSIALEEYLKADRIAPSAEEHAYALANVLCSLENLGEHSPSTKERLLLHLDHIPAKSRRIIHSILNFHKDTRAFREGNWATLFANATTPPGSITQGDHFRIWISELPSSKYFQACTPTFRDSYLLQSRKLARGSFRLRTIQGLQSPKDKELFQPQEIADRLYLWTWRWMAFPDQLPTSALLELCNWITANNFQSRYTFDDKLLIQNSMAWLQFLLPSERPHFSRLLSSLSLNRTPTLYFDFESETIRLLSLAQKGIIDATSLESYFEHPLGRSGTHYLADLLRFAIGQEVRVPQHLLEMANRLRDYVAIPSRFSGVAVYLYAHRIERGNGKPTILSESLSRAVALLADNREVPFSRFLYETFGLPRFDSFTHSSKILNLTARMRTILPLGASVKTAGEVVYAVGDWSQVKIYRGYSPSLPHLSVQELVSVNTHLWENDIGSNGAPNTGLVNAHLAKLPADRPFTRSDIERLAKISKTSATRNLKLWLEAGWIKRLGNARRTTYIKPSMVNDLL